jgi:hypothetical protein
MRQLSCTVLILLSTSAACLAAQPTAIELHLSPIIGSSFRDGDVLEPDQGGMVRWVRGGRLIANLIDSQGLLSSDGSLTPGAPLYVLDGLGQQADLAHSEGALYLSTTAPMRILWPRGHTRPKGGVQAETLYGDMIWNGGDVLVTNTTIAIFWGPQWTNPAFAGDKISGLDTFFEGFGFSQYIGNTTEYSGTPSGGLYGNSTYLGHVIDTSAPPNTSMTVNALIAEACQITGNHPDPNALYLIYTSNGVGAGVFYCAFHTWGNCGGTSGPPIQAAYIPNVDGVAACDPQDTWTSHSQGLAAVANLSAHELAEAITDPRGLGWYDGGGTGGENGDKCAWAFHNVVWLGNAFPWKLQMLWSNRAFDGWEGYPNLDGQQGCLQ